MKTIQLAIENPELTRALGDLLTHDGAHRVYRVPRPDLRLDGVVVVDEAQLGDLAIFDREPERFVVITPKSSDRLARIWDAGVRHVVFEGDSASTAYLAVIAAEMRLPKQTFRASKNPGFSPCAEVRHVTPPPSLPIVDPPARCGRCILRCKPDF